MGYSVGRRLEREIASSGPSGSAPARTASVVEAPALLPARISASAVVRRSKSWSDSRKLALAAAAAGLGLSARDPASIGAGVGGAIWRRLALTRRIPEC